MTSLIFLVALKSSWPILYSYEGIPTKFHCCQTPNGRINLGGGFLLPVQYRSSSDPFQNRVNPFFHLLMTDNVIVFGCLSVIYHHQRPGSHTSAIISDCNTKNIIEFVPVRPTSFPGYSHEEYPGTGARFLGRIWKLFRAKTFFIAFSPLRVCLSPHK